MLLQVFVEPSTVQLLSPATPELMLYVVFWAGQLSWLLLPPAFGVFNAHEAPPVESRQPRAEFARALFEPLEQNTVTEPFCSMVAVQFPPALCVSR